LQNLESQRKQSNDDRPSSNEQDSPDCPPFWQIASIVPEHDPPMRVLTFTEALELEQSLPEERKVGH
jgi:hypothetical protein